MFKKLSVFLFFIFSVSTIAETRYIVMRAPIQKYMADQYGNKRYWSSFVYTKPLKIDLDEFSIEVAKTTFHKLMKNDSVSKHSIEVIVDVANRSELNKAMKGDKWYKLAEVQKVRISNSHLRKYK